MFIYSSLLDVLWSLNLRSDMNSDMKDGQHDKTRENWEKNPGYHIKNWLFWCIIYVVICRTHGVTYSRTKSSSIHCATDCRGEEKTHSVGNLCFQLNYHHISLTNCDKAVGQQLCHYINYSTRIIKGYWPSLPFLQYFLCFFLLFLHFQHYQM